MGRNEDAWSRRNSLLSRGRLIENGSAKAKDTGGWKNHKYVDKYRSKKTGKWVYVYELKNTNGKLYRESNSRKGMTDKERERDDKRHQSYNKKRAGVHAKKLVENLGKAIKDRKNAGKYLDRSKTHTLKLLRNVHNIATSKMGNTGKTTKVKSWLEKKMYSQYVPLKTYEKQSNAYKDEYYKRNRKYLNP